MYCDDARNIVIMIEMYYNHASSTVNDGIGGVLYLLKKILQA